MELKHYVSVLWKWSWLIVLATVIAGGSAYWRSQQMPRVYQSSTTLMIGRFVQEPDPNSTDFQISQQLATTYAQMVDTRPILEGAAEALEWDVPWQVLQNKVDAGTNVGSQLLTVNAVDTNPVRAQRLADEIARQLIQQSPTTPDQEEQQNREFVNNQLTRLQRQIEEAETEIEELEQSLALENSALGIQNTQDQITALQQKIDLWQTNYANLLLSYEGGSTNYLTVVSPANRPNRPISPRVWYNVLLAAAFGLSLSAGAAFLLEYLNDTIEDKDDVARILNLPTLGMIVGFGRIKQPTDHLITVEKPNAPASEAYRFLRTSILFSGLIKPPITLLVTSADLNEGKTTTAANLAVTMARTGKKVVLVDGDFRRPKLHRIFEVSNGSGLSGLLVDERRTPESALIPTEIPNLTLLPSGPLPQEPSELLMSEVMQERFRQLTELADVLIFDSPPVLAVSDATILSTLCNGAILVVDAGRTRNDAARRSKEALERVGARVLGVTLNKLSLRESGYYYRYSYLSDEERSEVPSRQTGG